MYLLQIRDGLWVNPIHIVAINIAIPYNEETPEDVQGAYRLILVTGLIKINEQEKDFLLENAQVLNNLLSKP